MQSEENLFGEGSVQRQMAIEFDREDRSLCKRNRFANKLSIPNAGPERQNRIVGIAGRKGSGKSSLTRELLSHCERLFLFDTMGEHTQIPDQFTDVAEAHSYIFENGQSEGWFQGSFIPEDAGEKSLDISFSEISIAVYDSGNMTYAVEELPMLSEPNYVPPSFNRLIRLGRHRSVNILYTAQRLSECPRRVTAATDVFVLFSHTEPRDLAAIAERTSPEVSELCAQLGGHEFLVYGVKTREIVLVDSEWYHAVLNSSERWTPAIGGKHGRSALWSLEDGQTQ
jgi:hypothetical protein